MNPFTPIALVLLIAAAAAPARADKRFAPVDVTADVKPLAPDEQRALAKLIEAARLMDTLFLRQVWAGNEAMLQRLAQTHAREPAHFLLNKSPWARLDKKPPIV